MKIDPSIIPPEVLQLVSTGEFKRASVKLARLLPGDRGGVVHYHLALCYMFQGDHKRAERLLGTATKQEPTEPDYWNALALCNDATGDYQSALKAVQRSLDLEPDVPDFRNTFAKILLSKGEASSAIELLEPLVKDSPNYIEARQNLAAAYSKAEMHKALIMLLPQPSWNALLDYRCLYWLAVAHSQLANSNESGLALAEFLKRKHSKAYVKSAPKLSEFSDLIGELLASTPSHFETEEAIEKAATKWSGAIRGLKALRISHRFTMGDRFLVLDGFFKIINFYLSYQQRDDVVPNTEYAEILRAYLCDIGISLDLLDGPRACGPLRIGVMSENLGMHITTWFLDWVELASKDLGAKITIYRVNHAPGLGVVERLSAYAEIKSIVVTESEYVRVIGDIRSDQLDLMFYPDVGMCPSSRMLSMVRLARLQCVHWGHPVTTGSLAIDYFISGRLMEPVNCRKNYSERLIRLPALGAAFKSEVEVTALTTSPTKETSTEVGFYDDSYDFLSAHSLFKHLPTYDWIFVEILARTPRSTMGFLYSTNDASELFFERIWRCAVAQNVDPNRIKKVQRRPHIEFLRLFERVKAVLDAVGWSGGNTTLNAFAAGTPVVTLRGPRMRANHTVGMYRRMGLTELVAESTDEYVKTAVRLIEDISFVEQVQAAIRAKRTSLYQQDTLNRTVLRLLKKIPTQ
jgi:protein O-GlcNAc transferase